MIRFGRKQFVTRKLLALLLMAGFFSIAPMGAAHAEDTYSMSEISSMLDAIAEKLGVTTATDLSDALVAKLDSSDSVATEAASIKQDVSRLSNRIDRLGSRIEKVGAGAAALAALHPMDFNKDDKMSFAAGFGNYRSESAMALGAYYRPDGRTMFSLGGAMGNGENMVNVGVAFALDRGGNRNVVGGAKVGEASQELAGDVKKLKDSDVAMSKKLDAAEGKIAALATSIEEIKAKPVGAPAPREPFGVARDVEALKSENAMMKDKFAATEGRLAELKRDIESMKAAPKPAPGPKGPKPEGPKPEGPKPGPKPEGPKPEPELKGGIVKDVQQLKSENAVIRDKVAATEGRLAELKRDMDRLKSAPKPAPKPEGPKPEGPKPEGPKAGPQAKELAGDVGRLKQDNFAMKEQLKASEAKIAELARSVEQLKNRPAPKAAPEGAPVGAPPKELAGDLKRLKDENMALKAKVEKAEGRIGGVEASLAQLKQRPQPQPGAPAAPDGKLVADVQQLQRENAVLKEKMATAESRIAALQNKLSQPPEAGGVPKSVASDVQMLKDENTFLKERLTEAESKIYELQNNMARLTSVVAKIAQKFVGQ